MPSMLTSGVPRSTATRMYATGSDEVRLGSLQNSLASHDLDLRGATRPSDTVIAPPGTFAPVVAIDDASNRTFIGSPVAPDGIRHGTLRAGDVASLAPTRGCPVCGPAIGGTRRDLSGRRMGRRRDGSRRQLTSPHPPTPRFSSANPPDHRTPCATPRAMPCARCSWNDGVATMAIASSVTHSADHLVGGRTAAQHELYAGGRQAVDRRRFAAGKRLRKFGCRREAVDCASAQRPSERSIHLDRYFLAQRNFRRAPRSAPAS